MANKQKNILITPEQLESIQVDLRLKALQEFRGRPGIKTDCSNFYLDEGDPGCRGLRTLLCRSQVCQFYKKRGEAI